MMNGLDAIGRRIRGILVINDRPFSFLDFLDFELDGVAYKFTTWTVKMRHFDVDILDECDKEEFHVTFEEGISDLFRICTKRMNDKRTIVRAER